jgi:hypothetical protein
MDLQLTQGKTTVFDDEDWPLLRPYKWHAAQQWNGLFYAVTKVWNPETKKQFILRMHRVITDAPKGILVDHENGDGLVNHRWNLRVATSSQNGQNKRKQANAKWSKYKGVTFIERDRKWKAAIWTNGKYYFLGYFQIEEDAAMAYDRAALEMFGEFARLNFPLAA